MRNTERPVRWGLVWLGVLLAGTLAAQDVQPPYVGSETCQLCHEDIFNAFTKQNPHKILETEKKKSWPGRACESCHGPGQKHTESLVAADIRNPARLAAAAADKVCLTCHLNQPTHLGRLQSSHAKDQVACTTCHSVHAGGGKQMVARAAAAVNQQCSGCHTNVAAQFQKPNHHRVPENAMTCVDCHNPHGSTRAAMTQAMTQTFGANDAGCFQCHGDKRGPFAFEHAPVRFEGCGACHEPHGSANPKMLTQHEVRLVCLTCHAGFAGANLPNANTGGVSGVVPPAFHDLRSPRYQNCTICHQKIHGSHVDRNLLR